VTTTPRRVVRHDGDTAAQADDLLVTEAPLEIRLGGSPIAVVMRTPGHDAELISGFALTEGIVTSPAEITSVTPIPRFPDDNRWELVTTVEVDPGRFARNFYSTSSCGVCGKASIDAVLVSGQTPPPGPQLTADLIAGLPDAMRGSQAAFDVTGGLHAAALFDGTGRLLAIREDIGRHNAVDKVIGAVAAERWPLGELILMVSGRVSFEVAQKAAVAGIPVVVAVSAASSLAVELAEELGMTVIGFVRGRTFNVYTGDERLGATR
jgi:FdhD protein